MLKKKQVVTGTIAHIDEMGNGIIKYREDMILVRGVLSQEEVRVEIVKRLQQGYVGNILEIIKPSEYRCKPKCSIYAKCGSCQLMHRKQSNQAQYKKEQVVELCKKQRLSIPVEDVLCAGNPYHYRNKMIIGFQKGRDKRIKAGFYEEFSHRIIPYEACLLHPKECDDIVQSIVSLIQKLAIEIYDEDRRTGLLRHVLIRYGKVTKQIMVVFVVRSNVFPARRRLVEELLKAHSNITTIVQNVNPRKTSIVLGNEERILYGKGYIEDILCGLRFKISCKSFYQINHDQCEVLYTKALDKLMLTGNEVVLDAYCGIGTIGMCVASKVKQVIGVELNKDAVKDAIQNAKLNRIRNIRFLCDDAGSFVSQLAKAQQTLDVLIMDPPRSGSSQEFLSSAARLRVPKILYISCNPNTQIRDIRTLQKLGYRVEGSMTLVDMFPFTNSIESVCMLVRK